MDDFPYTTNDEPETLAGVGLVCRGAVRSPHWPALRRAWLEKHGVCAACGTKDELEVHHRRPVHFWPELELDVANMITLCREHHYGIGHCISWDHFNPHVDRDCSRFMAMRNSVLTGRVEFDEEA